MGELSKTIAMRLGVLLMAVSCGIEPDPDDRSEAARVARNAGERDAIDRLYDLIDQAKALGDRPGVTKAQRAALESAAISARLALADYVAKHGRGATRAIVMARLGQASGAIVADDVSGIGVADDWLLVVCAVVAVATVVATESPAPKRELDVAWDRVSERMDMLAQAVAAAMTTATATATKCPEPETGGPVPVDRSRPTGRSTVDVAPAPDDGESDRRHESCETAFPKLPECWTLPDDYTYPSAQAALRVIKAKTGNKALKLHYPSPTNRGPCPNVGVHYNVRASSDRAGSIVCCPCCSDDPGGPTRAVKCRIVW